MLPRRPRPLLRRALRHTTRAGAAVAAIALLVALTACSKKHKPPPPPNPADDPFAASAAAGIPGEPGQPIATTTTPTMAPQPAAVQPLPLTGPAGAVGADGYPAQSVDVAALQDMLRAGRYAELTAVFEQLQSAADADFHKEQWIYDALNAFGSDASFGPQLDAWVAASPSSFAPLAARGDYLTTLGYQRRGGAFLGETQQAQLDDMKSIHTRAVADLREALAKKPSLVAARAQLIQIGMASSSTGVAKRAELDAGVAACPHCFLIRRIYMTSLTPRWGGSYGAMDAFAEESARDTTNPRIAELRGYADDDRCDRAKAKGDLDAALPLCDRALAAGPDNPDFLDTKGMLLFRRHDDAGADAAVQRAVDARPNNTFMLAHLVSTKCAVAKYDDVATVAKRLLSIDRASKHVEAARDKAVECLRYDADTKFRAGDYNGAIGAYESVLAIDPANTEAQKWLAEAKRQTPLPSTEPLPPEVAVVQSFDKTKALDDQLAARGEYRAIADMWTRYLAQNPNDANALFERGGTYTHLKRGVEAFGDYTAACKLGRADACPIADSVGAALQKP